MKRILKIVLFLSVFIHPGPMALLANNNAPNEIRIKVVDSAGLTRLAFENTTLKIDPKTDAVIKFIDGFNPKDTIAVAYEGINNKDVVVQNINPEIKNIFAVTSGNLKALNISGKDLVLKIKLSRNSKRVEVSQKFQFSSVPSTPTETGKEKGKKSKQDDLREYVEKQVRSRYDDASDQSNLILDKSGTIHLFLDEGGEPIYCGFPVLAKENYDKFQFHIISTDAYSYKIASFGEFSATPIADEIRETNAVTHSAQEEEEKYYEYISPIFGPYTSSFPFKISRKKGDEKEELIVDRTIKLLKTSRVSLNTGVVSSFLQNPQNVALFIKTNGDTTLIADNPINRGFIALVLTFHFVPRNLNVQPRNLKERFGFSIGTNLNAKAFDNFFAGLNFEIANGLFINAGLHYGQVNHVVNYPKFRFEEDVFKGKLEVRKNWALAPYASINVDAALFAKVFRNIITAAGS